MPAPPAQDAPRPPAPGTPDLPSARRSLVLAICCVSVLVVGMDTSILIVALPSV